MFIRLRHMGRSVAGKYVTLLKLTSSVGSINVNMRVVNSIGSGNNDIVLVVNLKDLILVTKMGDRGTKVTFYMGLAGLPRRSSEGVFLRQVLRPVNIRTSRSKTAIGTGVHSHSRPSRASGLRRIGASSVNRSSAAFSFR